MMTQPSPEPNASEFEKTTRQTPLYSNHVARGAKMVDFAGWQMPLQYSKVMEEHHAVRQSAGLFDISHMALAIVSCGDVETSRAFLDRLVPQNLNKLFPGKAVYTQFLNEQGGILDDIIVYLLPEVSSLNGFQEFMVICNAGNAQKDVDWMREQVKTLRYPGIQINDLYAQHSLFALQGPLFADVLARTGFDTDHLPKRFHLTPAQIQEAPILLSRTGYTGEDGVEIIVPNEKADYLWNLLLDLGKPIGLQPIGLGARDTLRLEAAYPLHGHDISESTTPLEAGLGWSVKLDKLGDFIGKEALIHQMEQGLDKAFYCFTINKRTIARQHDVIFKEGVPIGEVTSGSISPLFNVPIGMGYINANTIVGPGDTIQVRVRGNDVDAEIVERPFYQK